MLMSYISFENYTKEISNNIVLDDINIKMDKGLIYGLHGHNGSGKTMLLRAISGLIKPTKGYVKVDGKIICKDISFPKSIGVLIEKPGFWEHYTGYENLKILASIKNIITNEQIVQSLERVGLNSNDKRLYKKYSLGMKQRLAIAQAVMESPDIILLDEPTNALDQDGIKLVRKLILEEKERGATVVVASHNKEDIELLSDYKIRIADAKVCAN